MKLKSLLIVNYYANNPFLGSTFNCIIIEGKICKRPNNTEKWQIVQEPQDFHKTILILSQNHIQFFFSFFFLSNIYLTFQFTKIQYRLQKTQQSYPSLFIMMLAFLSKGYIVLSYV